ncbi:hypothetical protein O5D80_006522 [Batrachochytrium dendrobatidis]|nr:hypothetical protein O5D80_006522 [Batrachochytrium dendrobatidis]
MTTTAALLAATAAAFTPSPDVVEPSTILDLPPEIPAVDWSHAAKKAMLVNKRISSVELNALAALKIIKHCKDGFPATCSGQLLGIDVVGKLQITNAFPFTAEAAVGGGATGAIDLITSHATAPPPVADSTTSPTVDLSITEAAAKEDVFDGTDYQTQMLCCLRALNFDANSVGWYQSTYMGTYWNQAIIDAQYNYQKNSPHAVMIIYDPSGTSQGNLSLKALRLSDTFMQVYETRKFSTENILEHKLTPGSVFETIPLKISSSHLLNTALLQVSNQSNLSSTTCSAFSFPSFQFASHLSSDAAPLTPNFDNLELSSETYLEKHLERMVESVEEHGQEQWRWQGWQRSFNKEQIRSQHHISQMNADNAAAIAAGNPPIHHEEDLKVPLSSFAKVASNEPSRLETLIISNQLDTYCKQINQFAGPTLTKMFVAKSFQPQK